MLFWSPGQWLQSLLRSISILKSTPTSGIGKGEGVNSPFGVPKSWNPCRVLTTSCSLTAIVVSICSLSTPGVNGFTWNLTAMDRFWDYHARFIPRKSTKKNSTTKSSQCVGRILFIHKPIQLPPFPPSDHTHRSNRWSDRTWSSVQGSKRMVKSRWFPSHISSIQSTYILFLHAVKSAQNSWLWWLSLWIWWWRWL